jgi:hypothetical protein
MSGAVLAIADLTRMFEQVGCGDFAPKHCDRLRWVGNFTLRGAHYGHWVRVFPYQNG